MARVEANVAALDELLHSPVGPVAQELIKVALAVEAYAKRITHEPGTGRIYTSRHRTHQASAPGAPYASDTGLMTDSITHDEVPRLDALGLVERVGSNHAQARILELGGDTGRGGLTHIDARPYLRPALAAQRGGITP